MYLEDRHTATIQSRCPFHTLSCNNARPQSLCPLSKAPGGPHSSTGIVVEGKLVSFRCPVGDLIHASLWNAAVGAGAALPPNVHSQLIGVLYPNYQVTKETHVLFALSTICFKLRMLAQRKQGKPNAALIVSFSLAFQKTFCPCIQATSMSDSAQ